MASLTRLLGILLFIAARCATQGHELVRGRVYSAARCMGLEVRPTSRSVGVVESFEPFVSVHTLIPAASAARVRPVMAKHSTAYSRPSCGLASLRI